MQPGQGAYVQISLVESGWSPMSRFLDPDRQQNPAAQLSKFHADRHINHEVAGRDLKMAHHSDQRLVELDDPDCVRCVVLEDLEVRLPDHGPCKDAA